MSDNIVKLFEAGNTEAEREMICSELLMEMSKEEKLQDVVIIATDSDGSMRIVTSPMDSKTAYFMAGAAGQYMLGGG